MIIENLRTWVAAWEERGWLARIRKPVSSRYVLGALTKKLDGEKGVIFEKVQGHSMPVVTNLFFSRAAMAAALGMKLEEVRVRFRRAMEKPRACEIVEEAVFKEVVRTTDLNPARLFPFPTYHEKDAGPYITAGVVIAKDPETGIRNSSIHRIQVFEDGLLGILFLPRHLHLVLEKSKKLKRPMEVAVAIGVDPFTLLGSQAIMPFGVDELEVANSLRPASSPLQLARCATVDVEAPAETEIVLEGIVDLLETRMEGPFGEFPRYYSPESHRPVIRLKGICHRSNPIFYTILPASREHLLLGAIPREASILADVQRAVPSVRAVSLTYGGSCRYHLVMSMAKKNEGEARTAMLAAMVNNADIKQVIVVDEDVDIFDPEQVEWAVATRFQGDRDLLVIPQIQVSTLDPSAAQGIGTKVGIDATAPAGSLEKEFKPISIHGYEKIKIEDYL